ncbi:hypothetical protein ACX3P1_27370 [Mesorhizobium sp. A623]
MEAELTIQGAVKLDGGRSSPAEQIAAGMIHVTSGWIIIRPNGAPRRSPVPDRGGSSNNRQMFHWGSFGCVCQECLDHQPSPTRLDHLRGVMNSASKLFPCKRVRIHQKLNKNAFVWPH